MKALSGCCYPKGRICGRCFLHTLSTTYIIRPREDFDNPLLPDPAQVMPWLSGTGIFDVALSKPTTHYHSSFVCSPQMWCLEWQACSEAHVKKAKLTFSFYISWRGNPYLLCLCVFPSYILYNYIYFICKNVCINMHK